MEQLEKVEKLREKANVTYEEAKQALEACNWDMLDAIVYLEKLGKVDSRSASYKTNEQQTVYTGEVVNDGSSNSSSSSFGDMLGRFFSWCGKIVKKGLSNDLVIERKDDKPVRIPILVTILLLFLAFWVVIPLLIIGLFFDFRYSFKGPDFQPDSVNDALNKASKTAEDIKEEFKEGYNK